MEWPLHLRDLQISDIEKVLAVRNDSEEACAEKKPTFAGIVELLGQLTSVGSPGAETLEECVKEILCLKDIYKVIVVEDLKQGRIVATARLVIERKLTRNCGKCGHIEDVVVDASCRGQKLGKRLLDNLLSYAKRIGCYKVILDCSEQNVAFYERCGLSRKEVQMATYFE